MAYDEALTNVVLMLGQRHRRRASIKTTLGQRLVLHCPTVLCR